MSGAGASLEKGLRRVGRGVDKRVRGMAEDPERALYAALTSGGSEIAGAVAEEIGRNITPEAPPAAEPLPVMPVMDSEEIKRVRRRYTAQQRTRGGRESTRLTTDKLGAG